MVAVTSGRHDPGIFVALGNILEEEDENEAFKMYNDVSAPDSFSLKTLLLCIACSHKIVLSFRCLSDFFYLTSVFLKQALDVGV